MSRLTERRARASASVDRGFGERVRVLPMRTGGAVLGGADPGRPSYETVAKFIQASLTTRPQGQGADSAASTDLRGSRFGVSFALAALDGHKPPQKGDHVVMLEQPDEPSFRVIGTAPDSPRGRRRYDLVPVAGARP